MSEDELIEEWDWKSGTPTGRAVSRKKAHREGIPHEGVHLWVVRNNNGIPEVLFQHRARNKELYPDCLDITVGGHVIYGSGKDKIQKESFEEIGISPADDQLIDLGYYRYEEKNEMLFHREFQRVYLLFDARQLNEYSFTDGEVEGIFAVPVAFLERLLHENERCFAEGFNGSSIVRREVSRADFHPLLFADPMKLYMEVVITGIKELTEYGLVSAKMPPV